MRVRTARNWMVSCQGWTRLSLLLLLVAMRGSVFAQEQPRLDHFKVYPADPQRVSGTVEVQGQFDEKPYKVRLRSLRYFANPVIKNEENDGQFVDENAHLTWYAIRRLDDPPTRSVTVEVRNQFHEDEPLRLRLARPPVFLLVPTEKEGHEHPERLDHYLAYRVIGQQATPQEVVLRDQWTEKEAQIRRPIFFCVPALKVHNDEHHPPENKEDHLTVYLTNLNAKPREVVTRDQFGEHEFKIRDTANFLCVPSRKKVIDGPDTMRPSVPTRCPPVETICPAVSTKCPPVPTACSKGETTCPAVETKCPSVRTKCPESRTRCPVVSTTCPTIETKCPSVLTKCPAYPTACTKLQTVCPVVQTRCPAVKTKCPPTVTVCFKGHTFCPASKTKCPPMLTTCPGHPTICPMTVTICRKGVTTCPAEKTKCPSLPTVCPPMKTTCPVLFTTCTKGKTACPTVLTTCPPTLTNCAQGVTFCPATETMCLGAVTHCPLTFDCVEINIPDWKWKWPQLEQLVPKEFQPNQGIPTLPVEIGKAEPRAKSRNAAISVADLPSRGTRLPRPRR